MLAVDLLHEFELGIWKALFMHLIRLLHAAGRGTDDIIAILDQRYVECIHGHVIQLTKNN